MLYRPVTIGADTLTRVLRDAGIGEPHRVLGTGAVWTDPTSDREATQRAWRAFSDLGLVDARGLDSDILDLLAVLTRPTAEYYGWMTHQGRTTGVLAGSIAGDGVLARRIDDVVRLAPVDSSRLAEALTAALPPVPAGRGHSVSVPQSRLRSELGDHDRGGPQSLLEQARPATSADVAPFAKLAKLRRTGSGELYCAVRDSTTGRRFGLAHPIGYVDTVQGRWLMQVINNSGEPWVIAAPATPQALLARLHEARRALTG